MDGGGMIELHDNRWSIVVDEEYGASLRMMRVRDKAVLLEPLDTLDFHQAFGKRGLSLAFDEPCRSPFNRVDDGPCHLKDQVGDFLVDVTLGLSDGKASYSITVTNLSREEKPLHFSVACVFRMPRFAAVPLGQMKETEEGKLVPVDESERSLGLGMNPQGEDLHFTSAITGPMARLDSVLFGVSDDFVKWRVDSTDGALSLTPIAREETLKSGESRLYQLTWQEIV